MSEPIVVLLSCVVAFFYIAGVSFCAASLTSYILKRRHTAEKQQCSTILPPPRNKRVFRTAEVVYYKHCDVMWPDTLVEAGKLGHKIGLCSGEGTEQI